MIITSMSRLTAPLLDDHSTLCEYSPTFHLHEDDVCAPMTLECFRASTWRGDEHMPMPNQVDAKTYTMYTNKRTVVVEGIQYIDLLYMVVYPYNEGPYVFGVQVGNHVGDLEHVRILVDPQTERIARVYFGGHSGGYWKDFDKCHVVEGSVQVYSALGTHANYHKPGNQWRIPLILKDVTSADGIIWKPTIFVQAPTTEGNLAKKTPAFQNQRWWNKVPVRKRMGCL